MGILKNLDDLIEKKLLELHTAYLAKVISVSGSNAKIQPLGMYKEYGKSAQKQAVLSHVPFTKTVKETGGVKKNDIVVCICCDRDITEAKKGKNVLPPVGHHSMSDSIIIGVL